jgi:hypothetical protein
VGAKERLAPLVRSTWPCFSFFPFEGEATVRTTGAAMVSGMILTLYCCAASAGCNISQFDNDLPRALRGEVSNHLANFEYASDVDNVDGTLRLWNYVLNKRPDKGIAISWPKAGIGQDFFTPLPPKHEPHVQLS